MAKGKVKGNVSCEWIKKGYLLKLINGAFSYDLRLKEKLYKQMEITEC